MAGILNAILVAAALALTLHFDDAKSWIFAICLLAATTAIAVRLQRPVFGVDLFAALLWFCALEAVPGFRALVAADEPRNLSLAIPVFIAGFALEAVRRRFDTLLIAPAAAAAAAAVVVGVYPFSRNVIPPHESDMRIIGAVGALFLGHAILPYIKRKRLLRIALPAAVVVVSWLIGTSWPEPPLEPLYAVYELLGFYLPCFAFPAVAAAALIEAICQQQEGASSVK
jgi:hypothetical protein